MFLLAKDVDFTTVEGCETFVKYIKQAPELESIHLLQYIVSKKINSDYFAKQLANKINIKLDNIDYEMLDLKDEERKLTLALKKCEGLLQE